MGGDGHVLEQALTGSSLKYYRYSVALSLSVAINKATFLFFFLENSFLQPTLSLFLTKRQQLCRTNCIAYMIKNVALRRQPWV